MHNGVEFQVTVAKPDAQIVPLATIVEGDLNFMCDFLKWATEWCKKNGVSNAQIRNTPMGHYQIFYEKEKQVEA